MCASQAYYFNGGRFIGENSGFTHINMTSDYVTFSAYRFFERDPITFTDGFSLWWRNGDVSDFGPLFIAFDPELFMPAEQFTSELDELLTKIKSLPRQPGVPEIRIPSERGFREREIRRREGILVNKRVFERLQEMV